MKTIRVWITAGVAVFALVLVWIAWSRYTNIGIFIGGGGRYWVNRAAIATSDGEAASHLRRVLAATQYGVNVAENAVQNLPRQRDRQRLWRLLIQLAPNENWRGIYSRDLVRDGGAVVGAPPN